MSTTTNLNNEVQQITDGNDSIVIVDNFQSIRGGRSLNVTGFTPEVIKAGHVIIKEDATGDLKPMPVDGAAYDELPADHSYAGILIASILTKKPFAGILVRGTVNLTAGPYTATAIKAALKAALPLIDFRED